MNRLGKRLTSTMMVLVILLLGMVFPVGALAEYNKSVSVLGVNVNTGASVTYWKVYQNNRGSYTLTSDGASESDYNVKYDRLNQALTLNNVYAPNAYPNSGNSSYIGMDQTQYYNEKYTLKIILQGTNTFARPGYSMGSGIRANDGISLVIEGTGSLTLSDIDRGISANGDKGGSITISSGTININAEGDCGIISSDGNVFIHGGAVNLKIIRDRYASGSVSAISAGDNAKALISVKNAVLNVYAETSSGTNLFRVWNSGRDGATRKIEVENSEVIAQIKTNYGHASVFSVAPTVSGGTPYIGSAYDGSDAEKWNPAEKPNIGYDHTSFQPYPDNGNGIKYFALVPSYEVTVSANPGEGGAVSGGGTYEKNETATVEATANNGYKFINWTEDGVEVSTDAQFSFAVTNDRSLVANFVKMHTVVYRDGVDGSVFADVEIGNLNVGDPTPSFGPDPARNGYTFTGWSPELKPTVTGSQIYTATWKIIPVEIPQTGDSSQMNLWLAMLVLSGIGIWQLRKRVCH